MSDAELLAQLKVGNPQAVQKWFNLYQAKLLRLVKYRISYPQDAEEIVQETFLNCLKHLPLFRGKSSIWTWMQSVARHEIADYYRKKYAKKAIRTLPLGDLLLQAPISDTHEISHQVRLILGRMSHSYRELLLLKYVDKRKVKEIARDLGRSIKSVESDLFRARREFRHLWLETGS